MTEEEQNDLIDRMKAGERLFFGTSEYLSLDLINALLNRIEEGIETRISRMNVITSNGAGVVTWIEGCASSPIDELFMKGGR
jgi:hypothetical protein